MNCLNLINGDSEIIELNKLKIVLITTTYTNKLNYSNRISKV